LNWNTAGVKKGSHNIYAIADYEKQVPESNEDNNTSSTPLTINIQGNQTR